MDGHGTCIILHSTVWEGFCMSDKEQSNGTGVFPPDVAKQRSNPRARDNEGKNTTKESEERVSHIHCRQGIGTLITIRSGARGGYHDEASGVINPGLPGV